MVPLLDRVDPPTLGLEHRATRRALELDAIFHRGENLAADLNLDVVRDEPPETIVAAGDGRECPVRAGMPGGIRDSLLDQPTLHRFREPRRFVSRYIDVDNGLNRVTHVGIV